MSVFQHLEGRIDIRGLSISLGEGGAAFEAVQGLDCQIEPLHRFKRLPAFAEDNG